jgi:hypothetical protein
MEKFRRGKRVVRTREPYDGVRVGERAIVRDIFPEVLFVELFSELGCKKKPEYTCWAKANCTNETKEFEYEQQNR